VLSDRTGTETKLPSRLSMPRTPDACLCVWAHPSGPVARIRAGNRL